LGGIKVTCFLTASATIRVAHRCYNCDVIVTAGRHELQGEPHVKKHVLFIHGAGEGAFEEDGLLVASLQNALGRAYEVHYPKMPEHDSATYADWKAPIERELAILDNAVILVGHSVGGSVVVKYLSEQQLDKPISSLFLLATPYWGADEFWKWDEVRLDEDVATKLASIPRIFLYHSRDDEVVPFAHLALYAATLPQAIVRVFDRRGHQFGNDLAEVAEDIRRAETRSGR
jgi:predicted alpha/beta hydrolase family esterase